LDKLMQIPNVNCKIDVFCSINPSEDAEKIEQSISNVVIDMDIITNENSLQASSQNLESLSKIYESIRAKGSRNAYRSQLKKNSTDDSTWFLLNRQAAFVKTVALCSEEDESPLGPIKITLKSKNIERIIDWLTSNYE